MQPFERALQKELRREVAQVSIPDDMWGNISRQLDAERAALEHRRIQRNLFQRDRKSVV